MTTQHSEVPTAHHAEVTATATQTSALRALEGISHLAVLAIDPCADASITFRRPGGPATLVATSERVLAADEQQYETGQGPCLDAMDRGPIVDAPDVVHDERWPAFAARVAGSPFRSVLSFRLRPPGPDGAAASLNLYACAPAAFGERDRDIGLRIAATAELALAASRSADRHVDEQSGLREALESRDVIGQAKGVLMERYKISADQAFAVLRRVSQHRNVKLRDVALELTTTGELADGATAELGDGPPAARL